MIKFIRSFISAWYNHPQILAFLHTRPKLVEETKARAEWLPKNRFDYAWTVARECHKHRDKYGRKCRIYGGNCETCDAKHC